MSLLALTSTQENLWWGAVIAGLVGVLAVAALLTILVVLVRRIDQRVDLVKATLQQAAANTSDTALIAETAVRVEAVLAEPLGQRLVPSVAGVGLEDVERLSGVPEGSPTCGTFLRSLRLARCPPLFHPVFGEGCF